MATVDDVTAAESGGKAAARPGPGPAGGGFPGAELALRALLIAVTLAALVVVATSKQTVMVPVPVLQAVVPMPAKFNHSPALMSVPSCCFCSISLFAACFVRC